MAERIYLNGLAVRKAVHAGYCWGVESALKIFEDTAAEHPDATMRP